MRRRWSRREMLQRAAVAGAVSAVPSALLAQPVAEPYRNLQPAEARTLEAIVARLIPSDSNGPGALEAGAARYIDRALADALAVWRDVYARGLAAVEARARESAGKSFADLAPSAQDDVLRDMERNPALAGVAANGLPFFELVLGHTLEGTFGDPHYGGNRDFVGWELIGYPGLRLAVSADDQRMSTQPAMTRLSAYDLPMFEDAHGGGDEHDR